jgi:hypothetical protein
MNNVMVVDSKIKIYAFQLFPSPRPRGPFSHHIHYGMNTTESSRTNQFTLGVQPSRVESSRTNQSTLGVFRAVGPTDKVVLIREQGSSSDHLETAATRNSLTVCTPCLGGRVQYPGAY